MDPDVLKIIDDINEADTSQDEIDEGEQIVDKSSRIFYDKKRFRDWERPSICTENLLFATSSTKATPQKSFQFLFLDSVSTTTAKIHPSITTNAVMPDQKLRNVIRLFGVSPSQDKATSTSVCINVHGYIPYFYALPSEDVMETDSTMQSIQILQTEINSKVLSLVANDANFANLCDFISEGQQIVFLQTVKLGHVKNKIFMFPSCRERSNNSIVLKALVPLSMFVPVCSRVVNELMKPWRFNCFESNVNNNLHFLSDHCISGCTWLELAEGKYYHRDSRCESLEPESFCQLELDVHFENIVTSEVQPKELPPLRILSFDVECRTKENLKSTTKEKEPGQIIQIGVVLSSYSSQAKENIIGKAIFVLGSCAEIVDARVVQFYDTANPDNNSEECLWNMEASLLETFSKFVVQTDPDILLGYNLKNFDFPHLFARATLHSRLKYFRNFGRLTKVKAKQRPICNPAKRMYSYDNSIVNVQGRIVMDMYALYARHFPYLGSKTLLDVAGKHFPEIELMEKVQYKDINQIQEYGTLNDRQRLALSCLQDCQLTTKLTTLSVPNNSGSHKDFIQLYFEMSQNSGTLFRYLVNKSIEYNKYFMLLFKQKHTSNI